MAKNKVNKYVFHHFGGNVVEVHEYNTYTGQLVRVFTMKEDQLYLLEEEK